jgi:hypothetical protein
MALTPLQKMHRRAQKAEGELARMKQDFAAAAEYALAKNVSDRHFMLGWMLWHIPPFMHLVSKAKNPPPNHQMRG